VSLICSVIRALIIRIKFSKVGSRVCQKHNCLGFVFVAAIVTTCFGRAWPSSGHKLTLYTNEEKKHNCIYRMRHKSVNTGVRHKSVNTPFSPSAAANSAML
jgi:hypothetical protein